MDFRPSVAPSVKMFELYAGYARDSELEILELMEEEELSLSPYWGCARTVACYMPSPDWRTRPGIIIISGDAAALLGGPPQNEE